MLKSYSPADHAHSQYALAANVNANTLLKYSKVNQSINHQVTIGSNGGYGNILQIGASLSNLPAIVKLTISAMMFRFTVATNIRRSTMYFGYNQNTSGYGVALATCGDGLDNWGTAPTSWQYGSLYNNGTATISLTSGPLYLAIGWSAVSGQSISETIACSGTCTIETWSMI